MELDRKKIQPVLYFVVYALLPIGTFYLMESYEHNALLEVRTEAQFFNIFIFELLAWIIYLAVGHMRAAARILFGIAMVFGITNHYVMKFRSTPFVPWDIFSVRTATSVAENYDFTHIEGLGIERNNSIHNYFRENYDYVCALASQFTFQDDTAESITANTSLNGKKFCITGKLQKFTNRDALVVDIESKGGKVVSGVTKATDYLITNDKESGSSKNKKAAELNIPIINEKEYCRI